MSPHSYQYWASFSLSHFCGCVVISNYGFIFFPPMTNEVKLLFFFCMLSVYLWIVFVCVCVWNECLSLLHIFQLGCLPPSFPIHSCFLPLYCLHYVLLYSLFFYLNLSSLYISFHVIVVSPIDVPPFWGKKFDFSIFFILVFYTLTLILNNIHI